MKPCIIKKNNKTLAHFIKHLFSFSFIILLFCTPLYAQSKTKQPSYSSDWDTSKPLDNNDFHFAIGMSEPCDTEKEAYSQAWHSLLTYFANTISTSVSINEQTYLIEEGFDSSGFDSYSFTLQQSQWKSEVPLVGVKMLDKKTEKQDGRYIVMILGYMTYDDYQKTRIALEDEETSIFIYSFFKDKITKANETAASTIDFPQYSQDDNFTKWVRSNCFLLEFSDKADGEKISQQMEKAFQKLFRNILSYKCNFDGVSSLVVYNHPDYSNRVIDFLDKADCFNIERKGSKITVSKKNSNSVTAFVSYCNGIKDARKITVFGKEFYNLPSGAIVDSKENRALLRFKELVQKKLGLTVVKSDLNFDSYEEMRSYAENNKTKFSSRYIAFCNSETNYEEYGKKAWVNANVSFILYDLETDEEYSSDIAESMPMSATISKVDDEQIMAKTRVAIDNACNPDKNPESLLLVIQKVFNELP